MSRESAPKIIFGAGGLARYDAETIQEIYQILKENGVNELDTAHAYRTEGIIGESGGSKLFAIGTKCPGFRPGSLSKESILAGMEESERELKTQQVAVLFFHSPDPSTPIEVSLEAIQELYKAGKFKQFGLSNFTPAQVQEVYDICSSKNYVLPTVYQGNYNPMARHVEKELFPLLRKLKIAFYVYSPLAGGFLAKSAEQFNSQMSGRWDDSSILGKLYHKLYNRPKLVAAIKQWDAIAEKAGCKKAALAYRWVLYHSEIKQKYEDGMIFGASSVSQLKETLKSLDDGPLPKEVLTLVDEMWESVKDEAPLDNYHA